MSNLNLQLSFFKPHSYHFKNIIAWSLAQFDALRCLPAHRPNPTEQHVRDIVALQIILGATRDAHAKYDDVLRGKSGAQAA